MPFLKYVDIDLNGEKRRISEQAYDPKKHTLWGEKPKIEKKPVDLNFEPVPEISQDEQSEDQDDDGKPKSRRRK